MLKPLWKIGVFLLAIAAIAACGSPGRKSNAPVMQDVTDSELAEDLDPAVLATQRESKAREEAAAEAARASEQRRVREILQNLAAGDSVSKLPGITKGLASCYEAEFDPDLMLAEHEYISCASPLIRMPIAVDLYRPAEEIRLLVRRMKTNGKTPEDLHRLAQEYNESFGRISFLSSALRLRQLESPGADTMKMKKMKSQHSSLLKRAQAVADAAIKTLELIYVAFPEYEHRNEIIFALGFERHRRAALGGLSSDQTQQLRVEAHWKYEEYLAAAPDGKFVGNTYYLMAEIRRTELNDFESAIPIYEQALAASFSNTEVARMTRIRLAEARVLKGEYREAMAQYEMAHPESSDFLLRQWHPWCRSLVWAARHINGNPNAIGESAIPKKNTAEDDVHRAPKTAPKEKEITVGDRTAPLCAQISALYGIHIMKNAFSTCFRVDTLCYAVAVYNGIADKRGLAPGTVIALPKWSEMFASTSMTEEDLAAAMKIVEVEALFYGNIQTTPPGQPESPYLYLSPEARAQILERLRTAISHFEKATPKPKAALTSLRAVERGIRLYENTEPPMPSEKSWMAFDRRIAWAIKRLLQWGLAKSGKRRDIKVSKQDRAAWAHCRPNSHFFPTETTDADAPEAGH